MSTTVGGEVKRRETKKILFLLCLVLFLSTLGPHLPAFSQYPGSTVDEIAARVDDYVILKSEIKNEYLSAMSNGVEVSECEVFKTLVMNHLLLAKAAIDSVLVTEEEVSADLDRRVNSFVDRVGSAKKLEDLYGKSLHTFKEELRDEVKDRLIMQKMSGELGKNLEASPSEVEAFFASLSKSERPFYPAEVSLGQIVRLPKPSKKQNAEAKAKLMRIRRQLLSGESFSSLAAKHSMDPSVSLNQGAMGFVSRGQFAPEYEAAALSMAPGELSMPVKTDFGYHLVRLIERRGNQYNSQHILIIPSPSEEDIRAEEVFLDSLRTDILNKKLSFEEAARTSSEDNETSYSGGFFRDPTGRQYVSVENLDPLVFFTLDTLKVGTLTQSMRFRTARGQQAVRMLYYKDKIAAHAANLEQDYGKFRDIVLRQKREGHINRWFQTVRKDIYVKASDEFKHCTAAWGKGD